MKRSAFFQKASTGRGESWLPGMSQKSHTGPDTACFLPVLAPHPRPDLFTDTAPSCRIFGMCATLGLNAR